MELTDLLTQLKEKEWVDLTHDVTATIPRFSAFNASQEKTLFGYQDGFYAKEYTLPTQYGTHVDAPAHFVEGKRLLHELTLKEMILPLVVLHVEDKVAANHDYAVTKEDILAFEAEHGDIPPHSFVALASGWSQRWPDQAAFDNKDHDGNNHTPGWSLEALRFLCEERQIDAIGHETLDTDCALDYQKNGTLEAEYYVLSQDVYQVEVMTNLTQLPSKGAIIITSVPKIKDAPGFTARAFAILP
ncbi:cyclase family protein [Vagococcus sp. BWB3-3]|uniref:Cyclase family protein n=1 Tax=Vagococcus allomyrinae TaxID=2794353 RepID=A0A940SUG3_9ENTE|nr:cyclase family protein [Vagococcus allomyrinae]MBP1040754.1 cyclase family protein [Vagococcus allomyrinae]